NMPDDKSGGHMHRKNPAVYCVLCLLLLIIPPIANSGAIASNRHFDSSTRHLELQDFYRFETVNSPAISPDGRFVAYVRSRIVEEQNRHETEIWFAPTDGSAPAKRIGPVFPYGGTNPRWSPDGKLLYYNTRVTGSTDNDARSAWFLPMDQPNARPIQINGVRGTPIFSPDNQWIAFTKATSPGPKPQKQYSSEFERKLNERFRGRIYDWMDYRFDQRGYLPDPRDPKATPPEELYIIPREGGVAKQITHFGVDVRNVVWRPDSKALAFVANSHQRDEYTYDRSDLWTVTLDGQVKRLTDDGYNHSAPTWSPDGKYL